MKKAYKLFRVNKNKKGKLFPLFVDTETEIPIGTLIFAKEGEKVQGKEKVKSKLGPLAFRPGWHLSDIPLAIHIGEKGESGRIEFIHKDHVWCECEYDDSIDYQDEANKNGTRNGKLYERDAFLRKVPVDGYYRYKTSPNMLGSWIIAGNIIVNKILSDEEVENILKEKGYTPMKRKNGPINLKEYGFDI